ncbi:MAG: leucine-rich repeat domain-containing protein [Holosporaceae bacterium]|jgi:hypothetical protein|nr:leucine-rich repeat domain-containing protein [Holosporaceae bacterium]
MTKVFFSIVGVATFLATSFFHAECASNHMSLYCRTSSGDTLTMDLKLVDGANPASTLCENLRALPKKWQLSRIDLSESGITQIIRAMFCGYNSLHTINFPSSVAHIEREAFLSTASLRVFDLRRASIAEQDQWAVAPAAFSGFQYRYIVFYPPTLQRYRDTCDELLGRHNPTLDFAHTRLQSLELMHFGTHSKSAEFRVVVPCTLRRLGFTWSNGRDSFFTDSRDDDRTCTYTISLSPGNCLGRKVAQINGKTVPPGIRTLRPWFLARLIHDGELTCESALAGDTKGWPLLPP